MPPGCAEAAASSCALLPGARRPRTIRGGPGGPDAAFATEFELDGRLHLALNAGPEAAQSYAQSLVVACADQAEIDRVRDALADGGAPQACGWAADRFGAMRQAPPARMPDLLSDPERGPRGFAAMVWMRKLDLAARKAA